MNEEHREGLPNPDDQNQMHAAIDDIEKAIPNSPENAKKYLETESPTITDERPDIDKGTIKRRTIQFKHGQKMT